METECEFETTEGEVQENTDEMLDRTGGRLAVRVEGEDLQPGDTAGWTRAVEKIQRQRQASRPRVGGDSTGKRKDPPNPKAHFARKVTESMARAARMPASIPRDERKVILRPRGGLDASRIDAYKLEKAIMTEAGIPREESMQDTVCVNAAQNVVVLSTPSAQRIAKYTRIQRLLIEGRSYEIRAYEAAPEGTVKGVIHNIAIELTPEEIRERVVNARNPMVVDAQRIGGSTVVIILFQGHRVPDTVMFGSSVVRCCLYRQHHQVCHRCGKLGHRQDVCPHPQTRICFACGKPNPEADHEANCKPHCKLCGGKHPTGAPGCANRFKMPYEVKRRRWERSQPARSARSRSGSRRRSSRSQSGERVQWADVVKRSARQHSRDGRPQPQPTDAMQALRETNARLMEERRQQDLRMESLEKQVKHLSNLLQQQLQGRTTPPVAVPWPAACPPTLTPRHLQKGRQEQDVQAVPLASPEAGPAQPPQQTSKTVPQKPSKAPELKRMPRLPTPPPASDTDERVDEEAASLETEISDSAEDMDETERNRGVKSGNRRVSRVSNAVRIRRSMARIDKVEKELKEVKLAVAEIRDFLYKKFGQDGPAPSTCNPTVEQPVQSTWPPNPQT